MAKVRVHELAKEYGVESKVILEKLRAMGEFVKSASSTIPPHVVSRFHERYGDSVNPTPVAYRQPRRAEFKQRMQPNPFSTASTDPKLAEAVAILGVPVHQLMPADQPRRRARRPAPAPKRLTSWQRNLFDKADAAAWQAAGLGPDDGDLALRLAAKGLTPADLSLRVRGMRAAARLRGGEPVHLVIREIVEVKTRRLAG